MDEEQRLKLANEIAQAMGDLDAITDHARLQERSAIADWISRKASQSPLESRLLYYLLAKDIRTGRYLEAPS